MGSHHEDKMTIQSFRAQIHGDHDCFPKLASVPKGDIVEKLVVIDVNLRRIPKANPRIP
jgi:hypothetical protein